VSTPARTDEIDEREKEGSLVAAALACAVVAYGALLATSWRDPVPHVTAAAAATPDAVIEAPPAEATAAIFPIDTGPVVAAAVTDIVDRPERAPARMSTASLRRIWVNGDTRSLERALTYLRQQTLALHRCGMQVTAANRAVARCEGPSRASYTIDFTRTSGRWNIQRVSTR
jgi:hypothetical protein